MRKARCAAMRTHSKDEKDLCSKLEIFNNLEYRIRFLTNPKRTFTVSKKIDDLHCPCEICQNTERQIETDNSPHIDMVVLCYFINIDD